MNDFYNELLHAVLVNISESSYNLDDLLEKLKAEFQYEIEDYEILSLIEKCIEKNAVLKIDSGIIVITELGLSLLKEPETAYNDLWKKNNDYNNGNNESDSNPHESNHINSLDELVSAYNNFDNKLRKYIKDLLIRMNDYKFEEFVISTLVDYGEAPFGEITKKSGDGGIDGFLYKTVLKQSPMPVQAKCYDENNLVTVTEVRGFIGSLNNTYKNGAYFVTTSTFTNKAIEAADNQGIILIDGNKLVEIIIYLSKGLKEVKGLSFMKTPDKSYFK